VIPTALIAYGCVSVGAYVVSQAMDVLSRRGFLAGAVWALGPPAILLHGLSYIPYYLVGTALCVFFFVASCRETRRSKRVVGWSGFLFFWIASGLITYVPTF
jgi:hypothetical protein